MKHEAYRHEHPSMTIALRTRTRLLGTINVAWAVRGRSCGWGTCERPRLTFVGHNRINRKIGRHFAELAVSTAGEYGRNWQERTLFRLGARR